VLLCGEFIAEYCFLQIPVAVAIAVSVRIGHLLGAGEPLAARKASRVSATLSIVIGVVNSLLY
jgi:Na+-driven multidrug efflux pump